MLNHEIRKLNSHLPKKRKTLKELLKENRPSISTIRGEESSINKTDLERLSRQIPSEEWEKVRLPFVLMRMLGLGPGAYELLGDPFEQYILARLATSLRGDFEDFTRNLKGPFVFYRPQIIDLMKEMHSLIVLGFVVS